MESIFTYMERYDYENLFICQDRSVGLRAVIAIHDTTLGPATGGTRMWTYPSEMDAIEDALRLARGMTYKYAAAGVNLGGGKCVVIGDPRRETSEMLFRTLGRLFPEMCVRSRPRTDWCRRLSAGGTALTFSSITQERQ